MLLVFSVGRLRVHESGLEQEEDRKGVHFPTTCLAMVSSCFRISSTMEMGLLRGGHSQGDSFRISRPLSSRQVFLSSRPVFLPFLQYPKQNLRRVHCSRMCRPRNHRLRLLKGS